MHLLLRRFVKGRKLSAADRFHDPDGEAGFLQDAAFLLRVLQLPVHIVQLDLAELHLPAVLPDKLLQSLRPGVAGKAQVPDAALLLLPEEVFEPVLFRVAVILHRVFVHVVHQIEIEVFDPAAPQLFLKYLRRLQLFYAADILVPRELVRQVPALPVIALQRLADGALRFPPVIGVRRVEIVHAARKGKVRHFIQLFLVDGPVRQHRQAHRPETER